MLLTLTAFSQAKQIKKPEYTLTLAHPNPFYGQTTFIFEVKHTQTVKIEVLNILGQRQILLHEGKMKAGTPLKFYINASDLDHSKIFFYKITGPEFRIVRKLTNYLKVSNTVREPNA